MLQLPYTVVYYVPLVCVTSLRSCSNQEGDEGDEGDEVDEDMV